MKPATSFILLAGATSLLTCTMVACAPDDPASAPVEIVRSSLERNVSPQLSPAEEATLATSQATFAVDLYQAVRKQPDSIGKDIFLSPHSISIALAMAYAGAASDTAAEMKTALHLDLPDDRIHVGFDHLDLALASRGKGAVGKNGQPFRLNVTNALWGQKGLTFQSSFLDTLAVNYGAGLNVVDFIAQTEQSRSTIR